MGLIREGPLIEGRYLQLEAYQRGSFIGKEDFQRGRGFRVLFSISESDLKNSLAHNSSYFFRELQVSITCERSFHMFWFLSNRAEYIV